MNSLTMGKVRALQRASTPDDVFTILAIDHQDALRRAMNSDDPASLRVEALTAFKLDVLAALLPEISAVLLDPVMGAAQAVAAGMTRQIGLLVELEKADYALNPLPLAVEIDPQWSVHKIKTMGADGVKLFFYYHPERRAHAAQQISVIAQVVADCREMDIPLYAEPILYDVPGPDRRRMVIESGRQVAATGADVLKLEFPIDIQRYPHESDWADACRELSAAVERPWVLLSAGVAYEVFARQVRIACQQGASGFIAGRAVWGEAAALQDSEARRRWLEHEGRRRMADLGAIARRYARPWRDFYPAGAVDADWFRSYGAPS